MAKKFLTGITIATAVGGEYTFPIADGSANQAIVTDGNGNLSFGSAIASTAEDAQRLVCEMINASGSSISAFRPVCCVGIHSDGTPEIALARADNPLFMPAIGITQSSVGNNNRTDVLLYGKLEGVNTTPYATGDTLYVAPTGGWTTTRPTGNNLIQAVFKVGRIQQNNGSGGAFGAGQYQDLPNVPEGNVWIGNSNSYPIATPLSTAIPAALGYTPVPNSRTITINGTTYDLSANRAWTITTDASARSILRYVATASQTTFTISGGYTPGLTDVYRNGVKLDNSTDFTATNGTTIVLTNGASVNDVIEVYRYQTAFLANNALRTVTEFIATAGQTTFNVTYNSGLVDVFYNGSKLVSSEYTAGNGTSITLAFACNLNDSIAVHAYSYAVGAFTGQAQLNGTGFVKANGTTITYDNSTYLTSINSSQVTTALGFTPYNATNPSGYITSSALSSYLPLTGGTLTGALIGTSATFSGLITANAGLLLGTSQAVGATGTIGFNSTQGLYIYCKTGSAYDFKVYNGVGSTFMQVPTGTQNIEFLGSISSTRFNISNGFTEAINIAQTSGSTTKGHLGQFADSLYISNNYFYNGAQSYDDTSKANSSIEMGTGFIYFKTGAANITPGTKMTITLGGDVGIGNSAFSSTKLTVTGKSTTSSDFSFVANNSANSNLFLVRNDGNVGIGTNPDFKLDVNGVTQIRDTLLTTKQVGFFYGQTSGSGSTSFINTGIFYNTSIIGFVNNGTYFLAVTGNPNGAGSGEYRAVYLGYITVTTGYDFGITSVVQRINYTQIVTSDAFNIGALTVSVVFWNGTTETTQQVNGTTNNQIRIKVSGYNGSNIGAAQDVRITKIN
jgi:hypothetical protein